MNGEHNTHEKIPDPFPGVPSQERATKFRFNDGKCPCSSWLLGISRFFGSERNTRDEGEIELGSIY
jgi:hypothetical protein